MLGLGAPAAQLSARPPGEPAHGTRVEIEILNMRNHDGVVRACMTSDAERFPRCQNARGGHRAVVPAGEARLVRFDNVAPGTYAIALLHDENDNGRPDRVLGMMPREGFGFSNDAPVNMGPPAFEEAAVRVGRAPLRQTIRMRYML
ncbi:DUF2141 domain-containing protein [Aurantiacibacter poecillastricola]|uniref:DUF2141 domain-containing protein n=1 Tax=Aurantiacibacter poecillastricola TaxID=3064385 RepID=UPI00273EFE9C|nr:DUF2141 domain-containing protein [Aurantiacibacter sp. 219JJ12-13]MDP5260578.1 DUF2141 domain-containing protein [Aurantiacibacter sp. 219JJ12-13]